MTPPRLRKTGGATLALVLVPLLGCSPTAPAPDAGPPQPALELREGATATGVVRPGQPHVFPYTVEEGTYFEFHLDRRRSEIGTHVFEPGVPRDVPREEAYVSGEECPDPCGQMIWEVATTAGEHHLRVESRSDDPVPYRLTVVGLHPATERDRARHRGLRMYEEVLELQREGRAEEALARLLDARELFHRGEYSRGVAVTYSLRGGILRALKRPDEARNEYREAIEHWRRGGDRGNEVTSRVNLAGIARETGDRKRAENYLGEAFLLAQESGVRRAEANVLIEYCHLWVEDGRYSEALEVCSQAVELWRDLGQPSLAVAPLLRLAGTHRFRGETDLARRHLLEAQAILDEHPNPGLEATVHNDLAGLLDIEGEYLEALTHYQAALDGYQALGKESFAGMALFNMGTIQQRLGDLDTTLVYYQEALTRMETAGGDDREQVHVLLGLGWVHIQRGELGKADEVLLRALEIARSAESSPLLAACLERVGELHVAAGRPREAVEALEEALSLYSMSGSRWREPATLVQLAQAQRGLGEDERALELLFDAAAAYEDIGRRWGVADSYHLIAQIELGRGDLEAARRAAEQSVAVADSLRPQAGGDEFRTLLSSTTRPYFELSVGILMDQHRLRPDGGHDAEALRESERARARSLLEILPESDLDLGEEVPEELLAERASIRQRLDAKEIERQGLAESDDMEPGSLFRMKLDLEALLTELQEVERKIRAASLRYAGLTRPPPVTVGEIQRSLMEADTALLEYLLGDERSFLWVVTENGFRSYQLPGREDIEEKARCIHWLITAYGEPAEPEEVDPESAQCLAGDLASYRAASPGAHPLRLRAHRRRVLRGAFDRVASELSTTLLGPPVKDGLLPFRLVVVPDGALEYVPFAALPHPGAEGGPLVLRHELLRLPSASVLAFQRSHGGPPPAATGLALVADPVYGPADPRLAGARPISLATGNLSGMRDGTVLPDFPRLDFSGQEAEAIAALAPSSRTVLLDGFDANRETVLGGGLSGFRYVHFATHGVIDTEYPQLSSLVLSLVDRSGAPDAGGYLRLHDIYGLDLEAADLVVLSACETALGREVRGEGLVGLTRGFLYAGAERVIASLWRVQDRATADLMERMYRGLLEEGRSPADALRHAQLETRATPGGGYDFPYYWAGFVLQGEWR